MTKMVNYRKTIHCPKCNKDADVRFDHTMKICIECWGVNLKPFIEEIFSLKKEVSLLKPLQKPELSSSSNLTQSQKPTK